jgi:sugar fermentation stimulation protein A
MLNIFVEIKGKMLEGVFKERLTRFSAVVRVDGKNVQCFLPNPGRLRELLVSDAKVLLRESGSARNRKTVYDIIGVYDGDMVVSIDSRVPNRLVFEALKNEGLPEFVGYTEIKPEYSYGGVRFDFLLKGGCLKPCFLEVKSCTLVRDGIAIFPDAPTKRGARHALELAKAVEEGYRAAVIFVVQRGDARVFVPNDEMDPFFGRALRKAAERGVEIYAYSASFTRYKIVLGGKVKVLL